MFKASKKIRQQVKKNVFPCENGTKIYTVNQCEMSNSKTCFKTQFSKTCLI